MRRGLAGLGWAMAVLLALLLAYGAAGLIGGAIPANPGWTPPRTGVRIYVTDNGIHTDLVLPVVAQGTDWRRLARPQDLRDPRYAGYGWIAIGWGERRFYVETPTWADVRPATILAAAAGSDRTVLHTEYLPEPVAGPQVRAITLRPGEYRRLTAYLQTKFSLSRGMAIPLQGYFSSDAFYVSNGHYDLLRTCNSFTGAALRAAGIRVGRWTPFPSTVMGWFPSARPPS